MGIGTAETTIQVDNGKMRQISKIMNMGKCFSEIKVIVMLFYVYKHNFTLSYTAMLRI